MSKHLLSGVYAAAITPINQDLSIALDDIPPFLAFLADHGCHGALLLGTTGEGPSFSLNERLDIFKAAIRVREVHPEFRLLAGTGTPSLEETIVLTKSSFDLGFEAAVVLPPYYYHRATVEGLTTWFQELIKRAVPQDRTILGYHFPDQTGVPIPLPVISTLRKSFPVKFSGLKDSTASAEYTLQLGKTLDRDTLVLIGNERIFLKTLEAGSSGCITAIANLQASSLRKIWDCYQNEETALEEQEKLITLSEIIAPHRPFPAAFKTLLHHFHNFPNWSVRPPLTPLSTSTIDLLIHGIQDWKLSI